MDNDMSYQIKWIWKLNLSLNNNHVLKLNETRFVLELQRNLISLGELDEKRDMRIHRGFMKLYSLA